MGKSVGTFLKVGAFAALGGLTGGLFTAGAFSTVGASAGIMLGGALFAQPQAAGVSSVQDLKANKSDPAFLPIVCGGKIDDPANAGQQLDGGVWLPGLVIKTAPGGGITRVKAKKKKKHGTGGKLFGSQQTGGDSHYLSLAVAWCEGSTAHPQKLLELKADDKIMFREGALENEDGYVERTFLVDTHGRQIGWQSENIRHHYGTGTQRPDDAVEGWYQEEELHAPAFRGTSYTVILNHQIDDFGHVPSYYARLANDVVERREQCRFYLLRSNGLDGEETLPPSVLNLSGDWGQQRGWFMTQAQAPREIGELIASRAKRALVEHSYAIWDIDLANPTIWTLTDDELSAMLQGEGGGDKPARFSRGLDSDIELPSRVEVRYADFRKRDENTVPAILPTAPHENVLTFDMPCVDTEEEMQGWGQTMLDAAWMARTPGEVSTLPRRIQVTPGDVVRVPVKDRPGQFTAIMVKNRTVGAPGPLTFQGTTWDAAVYTEPPVIVPTIRPVDATAWAAPKLFVANSVCLSNEMKDDAGVIYAACQTPDFKWEKGVIVNFDAKTGTGADDWDEFDQESISEQATMGYLTTPWLPPDASRGYVDDRPLHAEMFNGQLVTVTQAEARGGANVLLLETGEVVTFTVALQTGLTAWGLGAYELTGLKARRWGSDDVSAGLVPAGTRFVLLLDEDGLEYEDVVRFHSFKSERVGKQLRLRANMIEKEKAKTLREFTLTGANVKALSPTGLRATLTGAGLTISGRARVRGADVGGWGAARVAMTEPRRGAGYRFWVTLTSGNTTKRIERFTQDDQGRFAWTWSAGELSALFGAVPTALTGAVAMDGDFGVGFSRTWAATVEETINGN